MRPQPHNSSSFLHIINQERPGLQLGPWPGMHHHGTNGWYTGEPMKHAVFVVFCSDRIILLLLCVDLRGIYTYPLGLVHRHWGNCIIAPAPVKYTWKIWVIMICTKPHLCASCAHKLEGILQVTVCAKSRYIKHDTWLWQTYSHIYASLMSENKMSNILFIKLYFTLMYLHPYSITTSKTPWNIGEILYRYYIFTSFTALHSHCNGTPVNELHKPYQICNMYIPGVPTEGNNWWQ